MAHERFVGTRNEHTSARQVEKAVSEPPGLRVRCRYSRCATMCPGF